MQPDRLKRLLAEYFNNSISSVDCIELLKYLDSADPAELDSLIHIESSSLENGPEFKGAQSREVLNRIKADGRFNDASEDRGWSEPKVIQFYRRRLVQFAAAVLIFLTAGLIVFNIRKARTTDEIAKNNKASVILPGVRWRRHSRRGWPA